MISAQAQLLQRASVLMAAGVDEQVFTTCNPTLNLFGFAFGEVVLEFDDDVPFNDKDVDKAIETLDAMIEDVHRKATFALTLINTWRG